MWRSRASTTDARRRVPASSWPNTVRRRISASSTDASGCGEGGPEGGLAMIRANTRGRLTAADLQLVILLLSRGSAHRRAYLERRLAAEGPDPLLDAPELLERLLTVRTMLVPSEALFFYVLVRHALRGARVDDRDLADYLAALLLDFGQRDRAWRVDWNDDQRHRYLVDILTRPRGDRRRPSLQGDGPSRQLRALAGRPVSRLYRGATPPQSGARRALLRRAGPPRLRHGVRPFRWPRSTAWAPCCARRRSDSPRSGARSTA